MSLHVFDHLRSKLVYGLCGVVALGTVLVVCATGLAETRAEKQMINNNFFMLINPYRIF